MKSVRLKMGSKAASFSNPPPAVCTVIHTTSPLMEAQSSSQYLDTTPIPTFRTSPDPICNLDCNFDSNLCSWNQMITDAFDWTWQRGSTPTLMTGPSADHTGDGHYLYIEANSASYGDTARLISSDSECSNSGPQCLQFWYHMYGSADTMGLHVYLLQNRIANQVWRKQNDQGNMWHLAQVDITATDNFQIIFEGRRGSNTQSDVAIDDVSLYHGHCAGNPNVLTIICAVQTLSDNLNDRPDCEILLQNCRNTNANEGKTNNTKAVT
uniref:MAM domain-containing protein n=1 Tax=Neolamprologus brichardi TaxID=32507 RepID=A0A3Q4HK08_NEOBR